MMTCLLMLPQTHTMSQIGLVCGSPITNMSQTQKLKVGCQLEYT